MLAVRRRVVEDLEAPAGLQGHEAGRGDGSTAPRAQLLEANRRAPGALARDHVAPRVLVVLSSVNLVRLGGRSEIQRGVEPVVVVQRDGPLGEVSCAPPVEDHARRAPGLLGRLFRERQSRRLERLDLVRGVTEHHDRGGGVVLEGEPDPLVLEETADEVPVGLVVLHAVLARLVGRADVPARDLVGDPGVGEHLPDDVGHALLLEDPEVATVAQRVMNRAHMEPGAHRP